MSDDDMSTPISRLGSSDRRDSSRIASNIMDKYNSMNQMGQMEQSEMATNLMPRPQSSGEILEMPPMDSSIRDLEEKFENRDVNQQLYEMNARDPILVQQYNQQLKKSNDLLRTQAQVDQEGEEEYEEYEDMEYEEEPLWRRWLNETRIVIFIVIFVTLFFNVNFGVDKYLCKYSFFGNENYDCNWKGVLLKSICVGLFSYLAIRFLRV
jgi:outer membrane protein OmpA-like peptidoglycan-associated protein